MTKRNLLLVQGGGPTQVLNATLVAIVEEALAQGKFERVLGARFGINGLADGRVVDLSRLSAVQLDTLRHTPGAALGSSRAKPTEDDLVKFVECLQHIEVRNVLFVGGNGTMRGAEVVGDFCRRRGYDLQILGVPKTVDNDIAHTDRCPGYASAARYIAQTTQDLGMDVQGLPQPVSILETMGRSVGWLAAASAIGKKYPCSAPHLVYVPEQPFDLDEFLGDLDRIVSTQGWAVAVVAEGIRNRSRSFVYQVEDAAQSDALNRPLTGGVAQHLATVVAEKLKIRCRSEKPGLLGRSSMLHVSSQDLADARLVGQVAVRGLLAGETHKMVALLPLDNAGGRRYEFVPLAEVAEVERPIPAEWLCNSEIPVNDRFFQYLSPLIGDLQPYYLPFTI